MIFYKRLKMMGRHQIFIEKERVAKSFRRGMATYDNGAVVQKLVNERLVSLLQKYAKTATNQSVLEVGCCTGLLTELLCRTLQPERLYLNDLVAEFQTPVLKRLDEATKPLLIPCFGDIEKIALPDRLDLVISSSAFQWLSDLPAFFANISKKLDENGAIVFSMFGEGTFHELSELIGSGLSYHRFQAVRDMVDIPFRITHCAIERDQLFFEHPRNVLKHIQETGVSGVGGFTWTPRRLERFISDYRQRFSSKSGVSLSYVSYYFVATKR